MNHPYLSTTFYRGIIVKDRFYFFIGIANKRSTHNIFRKGNTLC